MRETSTKRRSRFLASCIVFAAVCHASPSTHDIAAAVADAGRPASDVNLDRWRKPAEVIEFAGLRRGDRVADFMSGNGYFTRLFSQVVGPKGRVYAFLPTEQLAHCEPKETEGTRTLSGDAHYRNVRVLSSTANRFAVPASLDMVWTAQNYHDLHDHFMEPADAATINAAIYEALKPGGLFIVIDHVAAPDTGLRDTETLHRIDPQSVRREVTAAGFVFLAESDLLRNPEDDHSLPVFDLSIRHRTDQVVLKFRKPG